MDGAEHDNSYYQSEYSVRNRIKGGRKVKSNSAVWREHVRIEKE